MVNTTNTLQGYAGVVLTNRRRGSKSRKMYLRNITKFLLSISIAMIQLEMITISHEKNK